MIPKPFSGIRYHENEDKCTEDQEPCVICGKGLDKHKVRGWLRVVDGGLRFAARDEEVESDGAMGWFPIGSGCLRKHKKDLADLVEYYRPNPLHDEMERLGWTPY